MGRYEVAKVTTIIEIVLSFLGGLLLAALLETSELRVTLASSLLGMEFYGLRERRSTWVMIGIIARCIFVVLYTLLGIYIFKFVAPVFDDIETALGDDEGFGLDVVSTVRYFNFCIFTAKVSLIFFFYYANENQIN